MILTPATRKQLLRQLVGDILKIKKANGAPYDLNIVDRNRYNWSQLAAGGNITYPFVFVNDGPADCDQILQDVSYTVLRLSLICGVKALVNEEISDVICDFLNMVRRSIMANPHRNNGTTNLAHGTKVVSADVGESFNPRLRDAVGELIIDIAFLEVLA